MPTVPAQGQFGPDYFDVSSRKRTTTAPAKYLRDSTGDNYVIEPFTNKPYVVPRDYDPDAVAEYFSKRLALQREMARAPGNIPSPVSAIYPELFNAFRRGGWADLQRPLQNKNEFFPAFTPAASFAFGLAAAAGGLSTGEAQFGGGMYNSFTSLEKLLQLPQNWHEYGNNPGNFTHITEGADHIRQIRRQPGAANQ